MCQENSTYILVIMTEQMQIVLDVIWTFFSTSIPNHTGMWLDLKVTGLVKYLFFAEMLAGPQCVHN
jgi:hypothetical protein